MKWIWTGTASGHGPPNSEGGRAPWYRSAPRAPGRVCASDCAGITPSEKPATTMSSGQPLRRLRTAADDLPETDLPRMRDALVDGPERLAAAVQVRRVDRVTGLPQLLGEREEPGRLPLRVMEQEHGRHRDHCSQRRSEPSSRGTALESSESQPREADRLAEGPGKGWSWQVSTYASGNWHVQADSERRVHRQVAGVHHRERQDGPGVRLGTAPAGRRDPRHFLSFSDWADAASRDPWKSSPAIRAEGLAACRELWDEFVGLGLLRRPASLG